jgi:hypothetical protein
MFGDGSGEWIKGVKGAVGSKVGVIRVGVVVGVTDPLGIICETPNRLQADSPRPINPNLRNSRRVSNPKHLDAFDVIVILQR